jgi:hypothetical protein
MLCGIVISVPNEDVQPPSTIYAVAPPSPKDDSPYEKPDLEEKKQMEMDMNVDESLSFFCFHSKVDAILQSIC